MAKTYQYRVALRRVHEPMEEFEQRLNELGAQGYLASSAVLLHEGGGTGNHTSQGDARPLTTPE